MWLPLLVGLAASDFKLHSGVAGLVVSWLDLLIFTVVPMASLSLWPPPPSGEPPFKGWEIVPEVLEFTALMGVPGFLLGLFGGALGRRFLTRLKA